MTKARFIALLLIATFIISGCSASSGSSGQTEATTDTSTDTSADTSADEINNTNPTLAITLEQLREIAEEEGADEITTGVLAVIEMVTYQSETVEELIPRLMYLNEVFDEYTITDVSVYKNSEDYATGTQISVGDIVAGTTIIKVEGDDWFVERIALSRTESNSYLGEPRIFE